MAVRFHELPLDVFGEEARPFIARLNVELRELFALEGALSNPLSTKRSDDTIARRDTEQVHVTRVTPDISTVVSGSSTVVGTPALTLSTTNVVGSTTTAMSINSTIALFGATATTLAGTSTVGSGGWAARGDHSHGISMSAVVGSTNPAALAGTSSGGTAEWASRGDHVHIFPQTIQSASGGTDSITLTQSGTDLDWSLTNSGVLRLNLSGTGMAISGDTAGNALISANGDVDYSTNLIKSSWSAGSATSRTLSCWDAAYSSLSAGLTSCTVIGFNTSAFTITCTAGSSNDNKAYCMRLSGPVVSGNNGGWTELNTALFEAPRRLSGAVAVGQAHGIVVEPATVSANTQSGIWVKSRAGGQVAANRYGIYIDAQATGTQRYSIYGNSDLAKFTGPMVLDGQFGVTGLATFGDTVTISGSLNHDGAYLGLYGATLVVQSAAYSVSNVTTDRTYDANSTTVDEIADVLGTLIGDLRATGIIG